MPVGANGEKFEICAEGRPITVTANNEAMDKTTITLVIRTDLRIPPASSRIITSGNADCCDAIGNNWPHCMQVTAKCQSAHSRSNSVRDQKHPACNIAPPVAKHAASKLVSAS